MAEHELKKEPQSSFFLSKWFLDFTGENEEAMIFYSAKLRFNRWSVNYTSWLNFDPASGVSEKSRFKDVPFPKVDERVIIFDDPENRIYATWETRIPMIQARIFESGEGFVDWKCYQPASTVIIKMRDRVLKGSGYAEQTILTLPPWKIQIEVLKWGRFVSEENNIVWIELVKRDPRQWLWLNGVRTGECIIQNDLIKIPEKLMELSLDMEIPLESEKKILSVVKKVKKYIPAFEKVIPLGFLLADEQKWLSRGKLRTNEKILSTGKSIHEVVKFNAR